MSTCSFSYCPKKKIKFATPITSLLWPLKIWLFLSNQILHKPANKERFHKILWRDVQLLILHWRKINRIELGIIHCIPSGMVSRNRRLSSWVWDYSTPKPSKRFGLGSSTSPSYQCPLSPPIVVEGAKLFKTHFSSLLIVGGGTVNALSGLQICLRTWKFATS